MDNVRTIIFPDIIPSSRNSDEIHQIMHKTQRGNISNDLSGN